VGKLLRRGGRDYKGSNLSKLATLRLLLLANADIAIVQLILLL